MPKISAGEEQTPAEAEELAPDAAFWAQEYFANQGEIRQTEEGTAYFSAPPIQQWELAESLRAVGAGQALAKDTDSLTARIRWMSLASFDAQVHHSNTCAIPSWSRPSVLTATSRTSTLSPSSEPPH